MTAVVHTPAGLDPRVVDFVSSPKRMFVDGRWVDSASGRTFETVDPATGQVITTVPHAGIEDVDRAVAAAGGRFESGPWRSLTRGTPADPLEDRRGDSGPGRSVRAARVDRQRQVRGGGEGRRRDVGGGDLLLLRRLGHQDRRPHHPVSVPWRPEPDSTPSPPVSRSVCAHRSSRGTSRW